MAKQLADQVAKHLAPPAVKPVLSRKGRQAIALPAALLALLAAPHCRAEWKFKPNVDLRETYTDNVGLQSEDKAEGRFVTEIAPGFRLQNNGPRLKLNAMYQLHYYAYDDKGVDSARHAQSQFRADVRASLIDDLLYFDGDGAVGQQAVSAFSQQINDNGYAGANRENVKSYRLSPYLLHKFGASANLEARYTRDHVGSGNVLLGSSDSDNLMLNLRSGPTFRTVGWGLQASEQHVDDSIAPESTIKRVSGNLSYRLNNELSLTANGGYDEYDYQSIDGPSKGRFWQGGFEWTPSLRTSLSASAGKRYFGNSYSLQAQHRSRRTVWNINYNDSVTTSRAQFLLPAAIDTATMLDRLFTPDIPDPVARQLAVDAYIRATGLPGALAENINYFSNRYMLQKQFLASVAYNSARSTLVLSATSVKRDALSLLETDGQLSGPGSSRLNDNTRQRGLSAMWNWRLNGRSAINASYTKTRATSLSTGLASDNQALRLAMTRQFQSKLRGALEVRRVSGSASDNLRNYRENALSASLSLLF